MQVNTRDINSTRGTSFHDQFCHSGAHSKPPDYQPPCSPTHKHWLVLPPLPSWHSCFWTASLPPNLFTHPQTLTSPTHKHQPTTQPVHPPTNTDWFCHPYPHGTHASEQPAYQPPCSLSTFSSSQHCVTSVQCTLMGSGTFTVSIAAILSRLAISPSNIILAWTEEKEKRSFHIAETRWIKLLKVFLHRCY